jgi:hypothetical protein
MEIGTEKDIKSDKAFLSLKVVATINIIIIIYKIFSFLIYSIAIKVSYSGDIIAESLMMGSLFILICTTIAILISTIGLFLNKSWGWWVSANYYFYRIVDAILAYFAVSYATSSFESIGKILQNFKYYNIIQTSIDIIFSFLIFAYLFNKKTRDFLCIKKTPIKLIILFFVISIGANIILTFVFSTIVKANY